MFLTRQRGRDMFKKEERKEADFEFVVYLTEVSVMQSCSTMHPPLILYPSASPHM